MDTIIYLIKIELYKILKQKKNAFFFVAFIFWPFLILGGVCILSLKYSVNPEMKELSTVILFLPQVINGAVIPQICYSMSILPFLSAFMASETISGEVADGSMKTLLIQPVKRYQVLISKYISILIFICILIFISFILEEAILIVVKAISGKISIVAFLCVIKYNIIMLALTLNLLSFSFIFALFTQRQLLSVTMVIVVYYFLSVIKELISVLEGFNLIGSWWLYFNKINFTSYVSKLTAWSNVTKSFDQQGFYPKEGSFELLIIVVFSIIFYFIALWIFKRKDVLN